MRWLQRHMGADHGFTLLEVLAATVLMTIIFASLATLTAQWMPNWNRGLWRVQQIERLAVGLDRIAADLAAAEFIPASAGSTAPLFVGEPLSVTFVRTALGPNSAPGLEVVRLSERADQQGLVLLRERAPFAPMPNGAAVSFGDPVVLVRQPYRVTFAYGGDDGVWQPRWQSAADLPRRVRISVRDAASDRNLAASTSVTIAVTARAECVRAKDVSRCLATGQVGDAATAGAAGTAANPPSSAAPSERAL